MGTDVDFGVRSDAGRIRENNEDSLGLAPEINLFVLSDGMGGQASGEVASNLATKTIVTHCREWRENPSLPLIGEPIEGVTETSSRLVSAIRLANRVIYEAAEESAEKRGMGGTVVAAWFSDQRLSLAHVGDSRAYRLRGGELEQLTQDHSFVAEQVRRGLLSEEEAERSSLQNVLLRALGVDGEVNVTLDEQLLVEGDTILLCSDGLTRELSNAQIAAALDEAEDSQEAADRLVELANQAGGEDNVSAIVVRTSPKPVGAMARIGRLGRWLTGSGDSY